MGVDPSLERVVLAELGRWNRLDPRRVARRAASDRPDEASGEHRAQHVLRAQQLARHAALWRAHHALPDVRSALAGEV